MGSASPNVRLRVRGIAVTVSVRFCGGGFDSFLGFEYGVVITLASHVFEYFFRFFLRACIICAFFGFVGVTWCDTPTFLAYPHVFLVCGPFIGFLGFFGIRQSYSCVGVDRHEDYSADSSASFAQCSFVGGFFPIFALVSDHLRNFCFYSWSSLWCCLLCSACLFSSLSLSSGDLPWGSGLQPTFSGGPCCFCLGRILFR